MSNIIPIINLDAATSERKALLGKGVEALTSKRLARLCEGRWCLLRYRQPSPREIIHTVWAACLVKEGRITAIFTLPLSLRVVVVGRQGRSYISEPPKQLRKWWKETTGGIK